MRNKIGVTLVTLAVIIFMIGVFSYAKVLGTTLKGLDIYVLSSSIILFFLGCPFLRKAKLDGRRS